MKYETAHLQAVAPPPPDQPEDDQTPGTAQHGILRHMEHLTSLVEIDRAINFSFERFKALRILRQGHKKGVFCGYENENIARYCHRLLNRSKAYGTGEPLKREATGRCQRRPIADHDIRFKVFTSVCS